jgi:hypothetical protein
VSSDGVKRESLQPHQPLNPMQTHDNPAAARLSTPAWPMELECVIALGQRQLRCERPEPRRVVQAKAMKQMLGAFLGLRIFQ